MSLTQFHQAFLSVAGILVLGGCDRLKTVRWPGGALVEKAAAPAKDGAPSAEDMRVAREAITIADVLAMLRADVPNAKIMEEVKRRRLPQILVDAGELELTANGAGHVLIANLKDPNNTLTENEDKAYSIVLTERLSHQKKATKSR